MELILRLRGRPRRTHENENSHCHARPVLAALAGPGAAGHNVAGHCRSRRPHFRPAGAKSPPTTRRRSCRPVPKPRRPRNGRQSSGTRTRSRRSSSIENDGRLHSRAARRDRRPQGPAGGTGRGQRRHWPHPVRGFARPCSSWCRSHPRKRSRRSSRSSAPRSQAAAPDGMQTFVTGPAGLTADLASAFGGIDGILLLVALGAVFVILLIVYRSLLLPITVLLTSVFALCGGHPAGVRHGQSWAGSSSTARARASCPSW